MMQVAVMGPTLAASDALQAQLSMLHKQLHHARQAADAGAGEALRADEAESQCEHLRSDLAAATSQLQQQEDKMRALQQEARTLRGRWQARQPQQSCPGTRGHPLHMLTHMSSVYDKGSWDWSGDTGRQAMLTVSGNGFLGGLVLAAKPAGSQHRWHSKNSLRIGAPLVSQAPVWKRAAYMRHFL